MKRPTPLTPEILAALQTFVKSGSANGREDMRQKVLIAVRRLARQRDEAVEVLKDIAQHANHAVKHGIPELAFESIRDKARAFLERMKEGK